MNPYVLLCGAILAEVLATTALKLSAGFSRPLPSLGVVVGYATAFYLLSLVLRDVPVGVAYGAWAAFGIVLISIVGVVAFDEQIDLAAGVGIVFIIAGVYFLTVISDMAVH